MEDVRLIVDIVIALGAAAIGGLVAQRLGLPALIGYILAGLAIGPNTPGLVADVDRVQLLANLGVALLMFGLGVEFSLSEVLRVRRAALLGGAIQIPLMILLGTAAGLAGGWTLGAALLLGGAFAISSSIVALKTLLGRGEMESPQARVALGLGIVQDFSLAPMLALVPVIAGERGGAFGIAQSLLISAGVLIAAFVLGTRFVPPLLRIVARSGSRELFMLVIVAIALGVALATHAAGLSLGLGAFLAGIVVSESDFEEQVLADIIPIRDIFATLFFVAVGMLIDPALLLAQWPLVLGLAFVLVAGKLLITGGALLAAGVDHRTATLAAVFMAQMGEFSFVLASAGLEHGLIEITEYGTILSVALCSILAMPLLVAISPRLVSIAERLPGVARQERLAAGPPPPPAPAGGHVVVCGFGRVGAEIGAALDRWHQPYSVIELNPAIVRDLRARGIEALYGDAATRVELETAGVPTARTVAVTTPDLLVTEAVIRNARSLNPAIHVIVRAPGTGDVRGLTAEGADEIVQPEFEAGLEFVRQVLGWQGIDAAETEELLDARRQTVYGTA
ncbi:MAG: cation:proton antiporter [Chloroflexota bacterium]|nr:cation:proton antiporter [Chloroflexota bacterium]